MVKRLNKVETYLLNNKIRRLAVRLRYGTLAVS